MVHDLEQGILGTLEKKAVGIGWEGPECGIRRMIFKFFDKAQIRLLFGWTRQGLEILTNSGLASTSAVAGAIRTLGDKAGWCAQPKEDSPKISRRRGWLHVADRHDCERALSSDWGRRDKSEIYRLQSWINMKPLQSIRGVVWYV